MEETTQRNINGVGTACLVVGLPTLVVGPPGGLVH